jgi:hypothetical protein
MLKKTQTRLHEKLLTICKYLNKEFNIFSRNIIFFPYIPRTVHALFENDPQRRIEFCTYFINKLREYHIFYRCVVCFGQINALSAKIVLLIETTITTGAHKIIMWLWNKISKDDLV